MTFSKKEVFSAEFQELAAFTKVLSHPAKLAVLDFLAQQDQCVSGDITDEIPLSRTTVSQHLQDLKNAGLLHSLVSGTRVYYCLETEKLTEMKEKLNAFMEKLSSNQAQCSV
jgi:DNA-binding transcriptional ArsR family regulator